MEVNAINGMSNKVNFEGIFSSKKDKKAGSMQFEQMEAPASKKSSNAMKALLWATMALGASSGIASCSKDDWGLGSTSSATANAVANAWYTPVCPEIVHDTVHVTKRDTIHLPGDTIRLPGTHTTDTIHHTDTVNRTDTLYIPQIIHDSIEVPKIDTVYVPEYHTDTVYVPQYKTDTVYVPKINEVHDTVYVPEVKTDTVYIPEYHTDTVYVPKVDTVYVPEYHTDTVYIPKVVVERDTVIQTVIQPINVKSAPWHVIDSLINQGLNVGIPLEGPRPKSVGENHVLFLGSRAYNEYDYQLYETQLDNIGTNGDGNGDGTLCLVSKITDNYNNKVSFMKTDVVIIPGVGLKLTRYVMSESQAAGAKKNEATGYPASDNWQWEYAGYEIRSYDHDGANRTVVYDKNGNPLNGKYGEIVKGNEPGEFLYGRYVYDEHGNPYVDDYGQPEKAMYDFSKGKMWSTEVKKVEGDFKNFTWG